jgi:hypothetical protein
MNSEFRKILAECIADMDGGAAVEDCLKRNPSVAATLRPHLETWSTLGSTSLVQPPGTAFNRGRREMLSALRSTPAGLRPLAAARFAPAWATVAAAVVGLVVLLGGAAGTSAALGGPDVTGGVFDAVGVTGDGNGGGISQSSASERGLECASPNAFEGSGNSEDKAKNADDAHEKESCSDDDCETVEADEAEVEDANGDEAGADCPQTDENVDATCEDENNGHGNDADHDDEDNPGQGQGNHGADGGAGDECADVDDDEVADEDENNGHGNDADHDDEGNPGQGQGNHGTNDGAPENGNANANGSANGNANGGDGSSGQGGDKDKD